MFRTILLTAALLTPVAVAAQTTPASVPRAKVIADAEAEFAEVDVNKDGQMTRAEIENFQRSSILAAAAARNKAMFARLDTDKNGQVSAAEFAKLVTGTPQVDASSVLRIDTNKDGKVSLAEHKAATLATFTGMDANKDGLLTAAEVQAAVSKK